MDARPRPARSVREMTDQELARAAGLDPARLDQVPDETQEALAAGRRPPKEKKP